jgi:hexokinase
LKRRIPVRKAFEDEVAELDEAVRRESEAVEAMENKRAEEIARGRAEIMGDTYTCREALEEISTAPVCTRIPKLLALGEAYNFKP